MKNNKQLNTTFNSNAYDSREHAEDFYNIVDDCCPDCGAPVGVYDKKYGCSNCGYGCSNHESLKANAWDDDGSINYSELLFK